MGRQSFLQSDNPLSRLSRIKEIEDFFIAEINNGEKMSKAHLLR